MATPLRFLVHICSAPTTLVRGVEHAIVEESHWLECSLDALPDALMDLSQSVAYPHRFLVLPPPGLIEGWPLWVATVFKTVHPPCNSYGVPPCSP